MSREAHVRFWESAGVKLPRATQPLGRGRDGPATFLKGYKQTLVADAYGGYDSVVVGNGITRAGCWAHARRKFVDAEKTHSAIAAEAVGTITT
jgi:transposase